MKKKGDGKKAWISFIVKLIFLSNFLNFCLSKKTKLIFFIELN